MYRLLTVFLLAVCILVPMAHAADVSLRISSDDEAAAKTLLAKLERQGASKSLHVAIDDKKPDYILIVTWQSGGVGYKAPLARVNVYSGDNTPLYVVERQGNFTKSSAVDRCAKVIAADLAKRAGTH